MQDTTTATTKWGALKDWDVSAVEDMSYAFSTHRNAAGGSIADASSGDRGNPKAASFAGTGLIEWETLSVTSLTKTFDGAAAMNAAISGWKIEKVSQMAGTFLGTTSLTSCNKRKIADAWKSSAVFNYGSAWASDTCVGAQFSDADFKTASWGTYNHRFILYHTYTP